MLKWKTIEKDFTRTEKSQTIENDFTYENIKTIEDYITYEISMVNRQNYWKRFYICLIFVISCIY